MPRGTVKLNEPAGSAALRVMVEKLSVRTSPDCSVISSCFSSPLLGVTHSTARVNPISLFGTNINFCNDAPLTDAVPPSVTVNFRDGDVKN